MHRRKAIHYSVALAITFGSACGSNATAPVVSSVAGTWSLTTVNAKPLPYVFGASDPKLEVIDKKYVISTANTFTTSLTVRSTELDGSVTTSTTAGSGTLTLSNNAVTFTYAGDGTVAIATVTPTTMTFNAGATQEFTRQ